MASDFRFVPDNAGFARMRNGAGVKAECLAHAQAIADRAAAIAPSHRSGRGATFSADVTEGRTRCHAVAKQDGGYGRGGPLQQARGF